MTPQVAGYPTDEAASEDVLRFRINNGTTVDVAETLSIECMYHHHLTAPDLFLVARHASSTGGGDELVGYVCATRSAGTSLRHESMSTHDPQGGVWWLLMHSAVLQASTNRHGVHP